MSDYASISSTSIPLVVKLWHAVAGLYFWEFFTNLGYEWDVIRGHRPYRWTIWVYSLTRVSTLMGLSLLVVCMDAPSIANCKLSPKTQFSFTYLSFASASFLLLLRIIAIWNHKKAVVGIAISIWATNVAFLLQGKSPPLLRAIKDSKPNVRFVWLPDQRTCAPINVNGVKLTLIVTLITDILLLVMVLVGMFLMRRCGGGSCRLQGLLWKQGVVWLALAAFAEIPPVVLIILDLGSATNLLFQFPSLVTMTIATTRIHHDLVDYAYGSTENAFWKDAFPVSTTEVEHLYTNHS